MVTQIILESVKIVILLFFSFITGNLPNWAKNFLPLCLLTLVSLVIFLFISNIIYLRKALLIFINQKNIISGAVTNYYDSYLEEKARTIKVNLNLASNKSLFKNLLLRLIKNSHCFLDFKVIPSGLFTLQPERDNMIKVTQYGFVLDITTYLIEVLNEQTSLSRDFFIVIQRNRDVLLGGNLNGNISIEFKVQGNQIIHKLCDIKIDKHKLNFYCNS